MADPVHEAADTARAAYTAALVELLGELRGSVSAGRLAELVQAGRLADLLDVPDWETLSGPVGRRLDGLARRYASIMVAAANGVAADLPITFQGSFDVTNPFVTRAARQRAGWLVSQMTFESRQAVNRIVTLGLTQGTSVDVLARQIEHIIGLTERQATAVVNFRSGLNQSVLEAQAAGERFLPNHATLSRRWSLAQFPKTVGLLDERADSLVDNYARRLLRHRAQTISRTETIWGANRGQVDLWRSMAQQGLIDAQTARQVWRVSWDDRVCTRCVPMDGKIVQLGGAFAETERGFADRTPVNGTTVEHPPLHPACRCVLVLETDPSVTVTPQFNQSELAQLEVEARALTRRRRSLNSR